MIISILIGQKFTEKFYIALTLKGFAVIIIYGRVGAKGLRFKMKYRWDKKYLYWGMTAFFVIAASIIFYLLIGNLPAVGNVISTVFSILSPIVYGLVIAYILMPWVNWIEYHVFSPLGNKIIRKNANARRRFSRGFSVGTVLILAVSLISLLLVGIIPQLFSTVKNLIDSLPTLANDSRIWITDNLVKFYPDAEEVVYGWIESVTTSVTSYFNNTLLPQIPDMAFSISGRVITAVGGIVDFLVGIIISVYVMYGRDRFVAQTKKILYAVFKLETANALIKETADVNHTFITFIRGQLIDSFIVGLITALFMICTGMPYAVVIGTIVGLTNIIPIFGPFIGAIPSAFLIFLVNPWQCLMFIVFILVLQQIDGNIIVPKLHSHSLGLKEFWIIFAILLGGGLFGFVGMICGVPVFAVIYVGLRRAFATRLKKKNLPLTTEDYIGVDHIEADGTAVPMSDNYALQKERRRQQKRAHHAKKQREKEAYERVEEQSDEKSE